MVNYSDISVLINDQFSVSNYLTLEKKEDLLRQIKAGLNSGQKYIPSRFFYDQKGSMLFEEITRLPEYYLTYTEKSILQHLAPVIMNIEKCNSLIELGSGDDSKISILIDAMSSGDISDLTYFPIDISESAISKSAVFLGIRFPNLKIHGLLADFMKHITLLPGKGNRLICFFGSTIGNLEKKDAATFLKNMANLMHEGDSLLVGMDMVKDIRIMEQAYNDCAGITAIFNKNILHVVNNVAGTNFDPENFRHLAFFNQAENRIEMHLEAQTDQYISSNLVPFHTSMRKGETIHTENSHKYLEQDIYELADSSQLKVENIFSDPRKWFSLVHFTI